MEKRLRHFNTDSLLVRGLIPVEAIPVLKTLILMQLTPKQIYFIWCRFHADSIPLVRALMFAENSNLYSASSFAHHRGWRSHWYRSRGLLSHASLHRRADPRCCSGWVSKLIQLHNSYCRPEQSPCLERWSQWISCRRWQDYLSPLQVSPKNSLKQSKFSSLKHGKAVESIDLSSCNISMAALRSLIEAWVLNANGDISLSVSNSTLLDKVCL